MTTPDESGLVYRVVTGDFLVSVEDSDDPDRNPDQHAPTGDVTATPLLPPGGAFRRSRPSGSQLVIPKPIPGRIENGRVVDENGEDGLTLLAEVDGTPVYWSIQVSIKDNENWTIFQATYSIGEWPEEGVHLPDLVDVGVVPAPELGGPTYASLLTGALTDKVDATAAQVTGVGDYTGEMTLSLGAMLGAVLSISSIMIHRDPETGEFQASQGMVSYIDNVAQTGHYESLADFATRISGVASDLRRQLLKSGATPYRPYLDLVVGTQYFDTTLGLPIWWDGSKWINASGTAV